MATACGGLLCGHAFGLKLPQLLHVVFELPGKGGVLAEGLDIVERGVALVVAGEDGEAAGHESQGEVVGFHGGDMVEVPGGVGDHLTELEFDNAFRFQVLEEVFAELIVGGVVFTGEDHSAAG